MKPRAKTVLSLDLGGTKIRTGLVGASLKVRDVREVATPRSGADGVLNALVQIVRSYPRAAYQRVAIGFAGLVTWPDGVVLTAPSLHGVNDVPLRRLLEQVLRVPITVENDATLWAYGEALRGAGRKHRVVVAITLGTGVGGGLIVDRKIFRGKDNVMEFGHMIIGGKSRDEHGGLGHLEGYVGGRAMEVKYRRLAHKRLTAREIGQAARRGDRLAKRLIAEAGTALALGLTNLIHLINPDMIVIGGSIVKLPNLLKITRSEVAAHVLHPRLLRTAIVRARLGPNAPLIGGALLARIRD